MNLIFFLEDENFRYYVKKAGHTDEIYYIKEDGEYIDLASAIEKELITPQQKFDS